MEIPNAPTTALLIIAAIGFAIGIPVFTKGYKRTGTGVKSTNNFWIQKAPQYAPVIVLLWLAPVGFIANNNFPNQEWTTPILVWTSNPEGFSLYLSWCGVLLTLSGIVFLISGWLSVGKYFSIEVEIMEDHKIIDTGLFALVMHPAYSGIIQGLLGASLVFLSPLCIGLTLGMIVPLFLNRAKHEEKVLLSEFGESYRQYAVRVCWRRFIPTFSNLCRVGMMSHR